MRLRRITEHVKAQNWFAVGIDFLIVVVGVFIGIQVSNWNADRQVEAQKHLIETRLVSDFELMREDIALAMAEHERIIIALHVLRGAIERGEALPAEDADIKLALNEGFSYQPSIHRSGMFIELLSSGRLDLISEEALRTALLKYDARAQRTIFNLNQIRNYMNTSLPEFSRYKEVGPLTRDETGKIILSPVVRYDVAGMAADQDFRYAFDFLIQNQTWVQLNTNGQESDLDEVIAILEISKR